MAGVVETHEHWQRVYESKAPTEVSWYEPVPETSLRLIDSLDLPPPAAIVDVGGGASHLAAELVDRGYDDVTVTDISEAALDRARTELGERASSVVWAAADIRSLELGREFDLWHDRALFHFLVAPDDREAYLGKLRASLAPGGHVVIATFGPAGPTSCSGLPVRRYGPDELAAELGDAVELVRSELVAHNTPGGNEQQFLYALLRPA